MSWNRSAINTSFIFLFALSVSGCESVALMPRPDLDQRDTVRGQPSREPLAGRGGSNVSHARREIVGTVQRVDEIRREIHLRTADRNLMVLHYDPRTVVYDRDRTLTAADLRRGDEIATRPIPDSGYDAYVDVIRMVNRQSQLEY